jgi:hypothetical protein
VEHSFNSKDRIPMAGLKIYHNMEVQALLCKGFKNSD